MKDPILFQRYIIEAEPFIIKLGRIETHDMISVLWWRMPHYHDYVLEKWLKFISVSTRSFLFIEVCG